MSTFSFFLMIDDKKHFRILDQDLVFQIPFVHLYPVKPHTDQSLGFWFTVHSHDQQDNMFPDNLSQCLVLGPNDIWLSRISHTHNYPDPCF
jgi:hypothetical protein